MRTLAIILRVAALVTLMAGFAHGREMAGKIGITPQIGLDIATGELLDHRRVGYKHELDIEYFYNNNVSVGLKFFYEHFEDDGINIFPEPSSLNNKNTWPIYGLGAQAKYFLAATPYTDVFGKLGVIVGKMDTPVYRWEWEWENLSRHEKKMTAPGISAGAGLSRHISKILAVQGEFEYNLLFTKGKKFHDESGYTGYDDTCRDNAQWFAIKLGLMFYLGAAK